MISAEEAKKATAEKNLSLIEELIKSEIQNGKYYLETTLKLKDPEIKLLEEHGYSVCNEKNVWIICWNT